MNFSPAIAFYFKVNVNVNGENFPDTSFMEVSGISMTMTAKDIQNTTDINNTYRVPDKITYSNLILKRGLTPMNSQFAQWCKNTMMQETLTKDVIKPALINVSLLDSESITLCMWTFFNAYPIKWSIDPFNSKKNELAIETIEMTYSQFKRIT
ncbi:MAG: phage tail protein [Chitinispirillaceae bacterium]|nr:phage tail protein [Chitinispirillaceae bacterium]